MCPVMAFQSQGSTLRGPVAVASGSALYKGLGNGPSSSSAPLYRYRPPGAASGRQAASQTPLPGRPPPQTTSGRPVLLPADWEACAARRDGSDDAHPGEGLTTAPWRSPRRICGGPGHQETSVSQKPPALAASPATCSLRRLKPAQQPSYLKPQPPQACPGTWLPEASAASSLPSSPATWSLSRLKPAQEPEPLPATRPLQPTATQPACSPQPSPVSITASSACPSSQDLCQPSHSSEGAIP